VVSRNPRGARRRRLILETWPRVSCESPQCCYRSWLHTSRGRRHWLQFAVTLNARDATPSYFCYSPIRATLALVVRPRRRFHRRRHRSDTRVLWRLVTKKRRRSRTKSRRIQVSTFDRRWRLSPPALRFHAGDQPARFSRSGRNCLVAVWRRPGGLSLTRSPLASQVLFACAIAAPFAIRRLADVDKGAAGTAKPASSTNAADNIT